jgi:hypothetical protein
LTEGGDQLRLFIRRLDMRSAVLRCFEEWPAMKIPGFEAKGLPQFPN